MRGQDYGIYFIGDMKSRYTIESVEQNELDAEALKCHLHWVDKSQEADARAKYNKYEYYRRSSYAEAIYMQFRQDLGITDACDADTLKEWEHKRWNTFMRSEGYVGMGTEKDDLCKTHPSLIPYQDLSDFEKDKDGINTKKSTKK